MRNFAVPAFHVGDLLLCELHGPLCLFEGLDFFDAAGAKIARATHATLVQPHSCFVHLPHALLNLTLPEQRTVLFKPERDLTQLTIQHLQAGTAPLPERRLLPQRTVSELLWN
jgi:hypothetical protein